MSDLGDLGDIIGTLGVEGAESYTRGALIGYGVRAGLTQTATMDLLRQANVGFRTQQFGQIYNDYRYQIAAGATAAALDFDSNTGELLPGSPPANWTGQYVHQVTATFRTRNQEGEYELAQRTLGIKASDTLTPYEAIQEAMGVIETAPLLGDEDRYPRAQDLLTMTLTGAWYDTNPGALS
jgi:hypothetical protein